MQEAACLYQGGQLIGAQECDRALAPSLGLVCPLCKEAVFWVREYVMHGKRIPPGFKHYKITTATADCELRSLSKEGRQVLRQMQKPAADQRLKLFNRRFWEIYSFEKVLPPPRLIKEATYDPQIVSVVQHCRDRWHVCEIAKMLPSMIALLDSPKGREAFKNHPESQGQDPDLVANLVTRFENYPLLRLKIASEVVAWLRTGSGRESFAKMVAVAVDNCLQVSPPPIHTQQVANMMVCNIVMTDWERAIASIESPSRAIGFGSVIL